MAKERRSFFERLTGSVSIDNYDDSFEDTARPIELDRVAAAESVEEEAEGQLTVDMYQTPDAIVIKAIVAGVRPDDLDISISRDMVTVKGRREESREVQQENYFYRELYWGSFSRTILLPQEIDTDEAEAVSKDGMLIIRLPKIDKERQKKLKVRSN